MTNSKNNDVLIIVSMTQRIAVFLKNTLDEVLDNKITIYAHSLVTQSKSRLDLLLSKKPKLIMAAGEGSYDCIKEFCPNENITLISRINCEPEYFYKLFLIPKNEKVLVVSDSAFSSMETIESLKSLGINHLKFIPYWPNSIVDFEGIDIAISPGMNHVIPDQISTKIDVGMRRITINSFIEILSTFNLDSSYIEKYSDNQKYTIVKSYQKLTSDYLRTEKLKNSLQIILNTFDEAIVSIDANGKISEVNSAAETLLGLSKSEITFKNINEIFKSDSEMSSYDKVDDFKTIISINNKQIYATYIPITINANDDGIFILREIEQLQKKGEDIKQISYQKNLGYYAKYKFEDIISDSEEIAKIIKTAKFLSNTDSTVLITGESGTGKEVFAQSIHNNSKRAKNPFVAVNFAALPDNLIESELFGYEEGAFTGAKKSGKKGYFELANMGTIFLDEIGDSSLWVQSRLLRVLEEREIMRLGDTKKIPINVRVIAATNKDLKKLVAEGKFREDLYYRINVFRINIPALRERKEVLPQLVNTLLKTFGTNKKFSEESLQYIMNYNWQGNFRELKNMIEYSCIMSKTDIIKPEELPYDIISYQSEKNTSYIDQTIQIYFELKEMFDIEHIKLIMEIINSNKNNIKKLGRNSVLEILKNYNINISTSTLRTIFKHLENYGLIIIGKTKQGTILSEKGEEILNYIKNI